MNDASTRPDESGFLPPRREARTERRKIKEDARIAIVEAVGRVMAREGLVKTTVEAIAEEAGLSKGGVLHYYPSKKSLLEALIDLYETRFRERHARLLAKMPATRLASCKAAALLMLEDMNENPQEVPNMASALDDPDLRRRIGDLKRRTYKHAIQGIEEPAALALVFYVIDGLWMDIRFDPTMIPKKDRKAAIKELLKYIDDLETRFQTNESF